jgi:hypothetical protein
MKKITAITFLFLIGLIPMACQKYERPVEPSAVTIKELSGGSSSLDSLMMNLVTALNTSDTEKLRLLFITEAEHNQLLGPEFKLHYPSVNSDNLPVLWENLNLKSEKGFVKLIGNYSGKNYQFVSVRFETSDEKYDSYILHQGTVVILRDAGQKETELRLLGSVVERNGKFKILSVKG